MKTIILLLTALAITVASLGQQTSSASADISAAIVTPIAIAKTVDLNFGNMASGNSSGTLVMAPNGTRSASGGVTLPASAGGPTVASFSVTGQSNYTYSITLPSSASTINDGSSHTMTVDTWTSNPSTTGTLN